MRIQGIRKYHDLESYIEKHILYNKEMLEVIIGQKITNIHMEVRIIKNRIDLVGQVEDMSMILIETSIRHNCLKDFYAHRNQILNILEYIVKDKFVQIILISPQFLNEDIREIERCIALYNARVYFVQLSREIIFELQNANDINKIFKTNKLDFINYLSVTSRNINKDNMFIFPLDCEEKGNEISREILKRLREKVDWHITLHRYKDLSKSIIRIGSGISDIILNIHCNNTYKVKIELDFAKRFDIFNIFKNHMIDMSNIISTPLFISSSKTTIYSEIPIDINIIDNVVVIANEYIDYFTEMYKKIKFENL